MKAKLTFAAIALCVPIALVNPAGAAEPSPCKGLDESSCTGTDGCLWRGALVAGETMTKAGTPAKRNVKAHCRKKPTRNQAVPLSKPVKPAQNT